MNALRLLVFDWAIEGGALMGKVDLAPYEAEIDQLCAKCVSDIAKELKHCRDTIDKRITALGDKVVAVAIPKTLTETELNEIPDRIKKILEDDSTRLKGIAEPKLYLSIDVAKKKLSTDGQGISGSVSKLKD
jgi:hypothetical protein